MDQEARLRETLHRIEAEVLRLQQYIHTLRMENAELKGYIAGLEKCWRAHTE